MEPLISVIVPVYNVEPYLRQCIDSILNQTYTNFELILVDDGSPDNCGAICDEYADNDRRIIVIHQENKGVSEARNAALDIMSGQYVTFVDSDDYITPDYLDALYAPVAQYGAEITHCGFYWGGGDNAHYCTESDRMISGKEWCLLRYKKSIGVGLWAKLYARHLFSGVRFPAGMIHEDQAVVPEVCYSAERICLINSCNYYYRVNKQGISNSEFSYKRFDNIVLMNSLISFFKEKKETQLMRLAKLNRNRRLAMYTILAKKQRIPPEYIPKGCRMSELKAFYILRKELSYNKFVYHLGALHPRLVRPYEYLRKIKNTIKRESL